MIVFLGGVGHANFIVLSRQSLVLSRQSLALSRFGHGPVTVPFV